MMGVWAFGAIIFLVVRGNPEPYPPKDDNVTDVSPRQLYYRPRSNIRAMTDDPSNRRMHSFGHPSYIRFPSHLRASCWSSQRRVIRILLLADASFCANVGKSNAECVREARGVIRDASEATYEPQFNIRLDAEIVTAENACDYGIRDDGLLRDQYCDRRSYYTLYDRLRLAKDWCRKITKKAQYGLCTMLTGCAKRIDGPNGLSSGSFCGPDTVSVAIDGLSAKRLGKKDPAPTFSTVAREIGKNVGAPQFCNDMGGFGDDGHRLKNCGFLDNGYIDNGQYYGFNKDATRGMCQILTRRSSQHCLEADWQQENHWYYSSSNDEISTTHVSETKTYGSNDEVSTTYVSRTTYDGVNDALPTTTSRPYRTSTSHLSGTTYRESEERNEGEGHLTKYSTWDNSKRRHKPGLVRPEDKSKRRHKPGLVRPDKPKRRPHVPGLIRPEDKPKRRPHVPGLIRPEEKPGPYVPNNAIKNWDKNKPPRRDPLPGTTYNPDHYVPNHSIGNWDENKPRRDPLPGTTYNPDRGHDTNYVPDTRTPSTPTNNDRRRKEDPHWCNEYGANVDEWCTHIPVRRYCPNLCACTVKYRRRVRERCP